jgi:nucleoid DNA-binding protein
LKNGEFTKIERGKYYGREVKTGTKIEVKWRFCPNFLSFESKYQDSVTV